MSPSDLPRRIALTLRYESPRTAALRALTFPLGLTPAARRLHLHRAELTRRARARAWRAVRRPPVRVVAPGAPVPAGREDVLVLDRGLTPEPGWLASLQHAARERSEIGIVGARILDPDRRVAHAGLHRDGDAVGVTYAGAPADHGPATIGHPVLAVSGECMYVRRAVIDRIGPPCVATTAGAVDYCLGAWERGFAVEYEPAATLVRARAVGPPEGDLDALWERWGSLKDRRVRGEDGRLRVVYVTEGTGMWGGHRLVFEDLNALHAAGHDVGLYTLEPPPDWFALHVPVRTFASYAELTDALAPLHAVKVATWWRTAPAVWRAAVPRGIAVYCVQDIESSYYPDSPAARDAVLAGYRPEFRYLTTSAWNRDRLAELGREAELIAPAVDSGSFRPLRLERSADVDPGDRPLRPAEALRPHRGRLAGAARAAAGAVRVRGGAGARSAGRPPRAAPF